MVTPHLRCEAKYLIRFHFTRGGPVPPNISKSHVELPGFIKSFFLKGKPFWVWIWGFILENWTWFVAGVGLCHGALFTGTVPGWGVQSCYFQNPKSLEFFHIICEAWPTIVLSPQD